jgi:exopolysaccharide biosynthesis polyprenyl glycosylphosphotransferase
MRIYQSRTQELADILLVSLYWFFIYIALLYLSFGFLYTAQIPRLIILFVIIIATIFVVLERRILDKIETLLIQKNTLAKTKIILILSTQNIEIIDALEKSSIYEIVGYAHTHDIHHDIIPYIGWAQEVVSVLQSQSIDELLIVQNDFSREESYMMFEYARIYGVRYRYVANFFETTKMNTEISFLGKIPVIEIQNIGLNPWWRVWKRIFDIIFSFLALIVLLPFFLIVAGIIFFQDYHNPFYKSKRVWKNGHIFDMYKFRSMIVHAEKEKSKLLARNERNDGPLFKIENDPRVTSFGRWIRRCDIDELPQLYNVLMGDMSLIGPRPHLIEEVKLYKEHQKRVLTLKPWITGMAQSHGRHQNTFDDEVRLDTFYIENWSLLLDIKILLRTIWVVLGRKWR